MRTGGRVETGLEVELERRVRELETLFALRDRLQTAVTLDELCVAAFDAMERALGAERGSIQIFDGKGATKCVSQRGLSDGYMQLVQQRWRSTFDPVRPATFVSTDMANDAKRESLWREIVAEGIRALISVPLVVQGKLIGKFVVYYGAPREFSTEEIKLAETISNTVAFAVDRKQGELALLESMAQLDLALQASNTGTWTWYCGDGRLVFDVRARKMFGLDPETELTFEDAFARVHADDRSRLRDGLAKIFSVRREDVELTGRVILPEKDVRLIEWRGRVFYSSEGPPDHVSGICQDVTEERRREEERRRIMEKLQQTQKLESLGILAGGIAHDFNNLLVGILGNVGLARDELREGGAIEETLARVQVAAERAAALAQQMLAYSGRGRFLVQDVDVSPLVREIAQLLGTVVSKKAEIVFDLAQHLPTVQVDPTQLRQVVMNLITNASDALNDRPGHILLKTRVVEVSREDLARAVVGEDVDAGSYVEIEVTDDASGIGREVLPRIFEPFYTTKFTGRGLGLAAVLGIVRGHKGAILVSSELGKGTTFRVLLPAVKHAPKEQSAPAIEPPRAASIPQETTIFVVDDEDLVLDVAQRILRGAGFRVLGARDGLEAVRVFADHAREIDLVLLDVTMPGKNGEEVLHDLRAMKPDIAVIFSSGFNEDETAERFRAEQRVYFLSKPYRSRDLVAKVRAALADK